MNIKTKLQKLASVFHPLIYALANQGMHPDADSAQKKLFMQWERQILDTIQTAMPGLGWSHHVVPGGDGIPCVSYDHEPFVLLESTTLDRCHGTLDYACDNLNRLLGLDKFDGAGFELLDRDFGCRLLLTLPVWNAEAFHRTLRAKSSDFLQIAENIIVLGDPRNYRTAVPGLI